MKRLNTQTMGSQIHRRKPNSCLVLLPKIFVILASIVDASFTFDNSKESHLMNHDRSLRGLLRENHRRRHVIRRIYGPENGKVRKEVGKLEEKGVRSRTGFLGDPNHRVEYKNHPYDPDTRERALTEVATDLYQPLRIRFETGKLDQQRSVETAAQIDFIKNEILPRTAGFWSSALSVVSVQGYLKISADELDNRRYCGDSEFTEVPAEHISTGLLDTDLVLYVSGSLSSRFCAGSTLAVAVACNFDQFDRPTAGAINFCLDQIEIDEDGTASEAVINDNVDVAIHEAAHVLGMSSNSFRYYWDSDTGLPRTPRPFSFSKVTCVDGTNRSLALPDENTMKFFVAENGQRYASITTPKVRAVARNQFDCQALAGAQLENQPTGSDSCTGDHWDERQFYPEALSGVISPTTNVLSHLTLALMEDTGWYKANFTMGAISPWGLSAGCSFASKPCLSPGDTPTIPEYSKGYFCNEGSKRGCSPTLTHKLACTLIDYHYVNPSRPPDPQFTYFIQAPTRGGPRQADYCPLYGSPYSGLDADQLDCRNPNNDPIVNTYNEYYGEDSMCFESSTGEGRCYRAACVKDEMAVKINVRGTWHTCEYDFQEITVRIAINGLYEARVTCPRLTSACPDLFCPFNCAGRGVCNYAFTVNGTVRPKCECFDESDTSPGCSDSLIPNGAFLEDASGLFNNLEENFFDPLVAVFVDHPDRWTTASWAWAAGLFTVFLIMLLCICSSLWPAPQKRVSRA